MANTKKQKRINPNGGRDKIEDPKVPITSIIPGATARAFGCETARHPKTGQAYIVNNEARRELSRTIVNFLNGKHGTN
jgi:hypothetical protein